jgi:hypothetical protein
MSPLIESKELGLSNLQKGYLRSRWLEQMLQTSAKYNRALRSFYALRLTTVVGCLFILLLVSLNAIGHDWAWGGYVRGVTIFFSLLVSVCVVIEHLFNFGESYRRYERTAERLKTEGWRFLQLSGFYQSYKSHSDAFAVFANQIEALSQTDVEVYNFDAARERRVEAKVEEGDGQKKFFPLESARQTETPAMMHSVVSLHSNPQRAQ